MARVVAIYSLPLPVKISADCFEMSIGAVIAGRQVTLTTPLVRWTDEGRFAVHPPQVSDLPHQPDDDDDIFWGKISEWRIDPPQFSGGWLRAVAFTFDVDEEDIGRRPSGTRWRPTGPVIDGLFDLVPVWSDLFLRWIGVVSDQDTFVDTPHVLPSVQGAGLSVRAVTLAGPSDSVWPTLSYLWRTEALAVPRTTFDDVVRATSRGETPPPAHLLVREARADMVRGNHRKAVIGAGSAVEMALRDWRQTHPPVGPDPLPARATLGVHVKHAARPLPPETQRDLVDVRNDAMHNGLTPTRAQAEEALRIAQDIVTDLQPLFATGSLR